MLTGEQLGAAIEQARIKKGVTKVALATAMGVKPASVQDWVKFGRIAKERINDLVAYFSDVVGPEHWGLDFGGSVAAQNLGDVSRSTEASGNASQARSPNDLPPELRAIFSAYAEGGPAKQEALRRLAELPEPEMATLLLVIQSIGAKYRT
ncbi:hypothetical protein [Burkholderia gladioli]|uniref:hypothetical protein n=1 Tax=Burkholderia gladioli TaxID=28095 RepID=UPI0026563F50|nr:hypothetical protein [Burkholderia gladioli]MDN7803136.1 hypothetical protein [Burkholderia gladioli]